MGQVAKQNFHRSVARCIDHMFIHCVYLHICENCHIRAFLKQAQAPFNCSNVCMPSPLFLTQLCMYTVPVMDRKEMKTEYIKVIYCSAFYWIIVSFAALFHLLLIIPPPFRAWKTSTQCRPPANVDSADRWFRANTCSVLWQFEPLTADGVSSISE